MRPVLAHGYYFYAPQVMRANDGRYLMWGWIKEARSQRVSEWAGWAGLASLPLEVSLDDKDRLLVQPASEFKSLAIQRMVIQRNRGRSGYHDLTG